MITVKKMQKSDVSTLYKTALRAFQPDYDRYGVYPLFKNPNRQKFLPPRIFGKTILFEDVSGAFAGFGKKGKLGTIFIDPMHQKKGYGTQAMKTIEAMYPHVRQWTLETPAENLYLHRFYESRGYRKTGEMQYPKSEIACFKYEKNL